MLKKSLSSAEKKHYTKPNCPYTNREDLRILIETSIGFIKNGRTIEEILQYRAAGPPDTATVARGLSAGPPDTATVETPQ